LSEKWIMVKKNSLLAWFLATRPKTWAAAAAPVVVACALAYRDGVFRLAPAVICLLFALMLQVVANFANDYFDYKKGSDDGERLGPRRAVAEGWIEAGTMARVTVGLLGASCLVGLSLVYYGGWAMVGVGVGVGVFALAYSGGPYPLAYHGWGDVCVLVFFGVVPVGFTYYVQALQWTVGATVCGIAVGLAAVTILVANNFRDRVGDGRAGKRTTVVMFGERFGGCLYLWCGVAAVGCCQYFWWEGDVGAALMPVVYLYFHVRTWREMVRIGEGRELIGVLGRTAGNVMGFGGLLAGGVGV
jgi:1,4-dihydroxy-2-naphthoate octaprenyltransferase